MAPHLYSAKPIQIIDGQYLDQDKLMTKLKIIYGISDEGKNNFRVEVKTREIKPCYFTNMSPSSDSTVTRYIHLSTSAMPLD
jgi:hypothetical protein